MYCDHKPCNAKYMDDEPRKEALDHHCIMCSNVTVKLLDVLLLAKLKNCYSATFNRQPEKKLILH